MSKAPAIFRAIRERDLDSLDDALLDERRRATVLESRFRDDTTLHWAAEHAWVAGIERLLEAGAPVDTRDGQQQTPLHRAASGGPPTDHGWLTRDPIEPPEPNPFDRTVSFPKHPAVVAAVLRVLHRDGLVDFLFPPGETHGRKAIEAAAAFVQATSGDAARSRFLRELEAEVDLVRLAPALHAQLSREWPFGQVCKLLLDRGADIEATDIDGRTPLAIAVEARADDEVRFLLDHGANPDSEDTSGQTPLQTAAEMGALGCTRTLLRAGALPVDALRPAAYWGFDDVVRALAEAGADLDEESHEYEAPLLAAARCGRASTIDLLLTLGASPDVTTDIGETPLHLAVGEHAEPWLLDRLVPMYGVDPLDDRGRSPLFAAAQAVYLPGVEKLLELRADATLVDCDGDSPLHAFFEDLDAFDVDDAARLLTLLVRAGANPERPNANGVTPRQLGAYLKAPIVAALA